MTEEGKVFLPRHNAAKEKKPGLRLRIPGS